MADWKTELDALVKETTAFAESHGVEPQFLRVNYRLEKEGPFDPGEMILSGSIP